MRTELFSILLIIVSWISAFGQGDNYVLFSKTGDTLITRTSCYCQKEDTLTSYFVILKNVNSNLKLLSVFTVEEPNKKSIPCADFNLVSRDTLEKYNLTILGKRGIYPKRKLHIKSKVIQIEKADDNEQRYVFKRTIRHQFKIGWRTFHIETLDDLVNDKNDAIEQPRIKEVFGNPELNKYYMIIITKEESINSETKRKHTVNSHKKILK